MTKETRRNAHHASHAETPVAAHPTRERPARWQCGQEQEGLVSTPRGLHLEGSQRRLCAQVRTRLSEDTVNSMFRAPGLSSPHPVAQSGLPWPVGFWEQNREEAAAARTRVRQVGHTGPVTGRHGLLPHGPSTFKHHHPPSCHKSGQQAPALLRKTW